MTEKQDYDSTKDTLEHIHRVQGLLAFASSQLRKRGDVHDQSKLEGIEKETFDRVTPLLKTLEYGSDEYKAALKDMGPALDHHYANNSHHPEHYENGIDGMNLFDLVEMFFDWKAATERHENGDMTQSVLHNKSRFNISDQLQSILMNTVEYIDKMVDGVYTRWPGGDPQLIFDRGIAVYAAQKTESTEFQFVSDNCGRHYTVTEPGWHYIESLLMKMKKEGEGEMVWTPIGMV